MTPAAAHNSYVGDDQIVPLQVGCCSPLTIIYQWIEYRGRHRKSFLTFTDANAHAYLEFVDSSSTAMLAVVASSRP